LHTNRLDLAVVVPTSIMRDVWLYRRHKTSISPIVFEIAWRSYTVPEFLRHASKPWIHSGCVYLVETRGLSHDSVSLVPYAERWGPDSRNQPCNAARMLWLPSIVCSDPLEVTGVHVSNGCVYPLVSERLRANLSFFCMMIAEGYANRREFLTCAMPLHGTRPLPGPANSQPIPRPWMTWIIEVSCR